MTEEEIEQKFEDEIYRYLSNTLAISILSTCSKYSTYFKSSELRDKVVDTDAIVINALISAAIAVYIHTQKTKEANKEYSKLESKIKDKLMKAFFEEVGGKEDWRKCTYKD